MSRPAVCTWVGQTLEQNTMLKDTTFQLLTLAFSVAKSLSRTVSRLPNLFQAIDSDGAHSDSQCGGFAGWVHKQDIGACLAGLLPGLRPLQAVALLFVSELGRTGLLSCRQEGSDLSSAYAQVLTDTSWAPAGSSTQPDA